MPVKSKRITFYSSVNEEAEANYRYLASLTSSQHLANTKKMIEIIFEKDLEKIMQKNIKFK